MQDLGQLLTGKANHTKDAKQNDVVEMGCRKNNKRTGLVTNQLEQKRQPAVGLPATAASHSL